jgi:hypothetical protein
MEAYTGDDMFHIDGVPLLGNGDHNGDADFIIMVSSNVYVILS